MATDAKLRDLERAALDEPANSPAHIRYLLGLIRISRFEDAWRYAKARLADSLADQLYDAAQAPYTVAILEAPSSVSMQRPEVRLLGAPRGQPHRATVGRLPVCDVPIPHPWVGGRHCAITHQGGEKFLLEDLKAANGTWIGGERIDSRPLKDGARFSPAKAEIVLELRLSWDGEPWPTPPAPLIEPLVARLNARAK